MLSGVVCNKDHLEHSTYLIVFRFSSLMTQVVSLDPRCSQASILTLWTELPGLSMG